MRGEQLFVLDVYFLFFSFSNFYLSSLGIFLFNSCFEIKVASDHSRFLVHKREREGEKSKADIRHLVRSREGLSLHSASGELRDAPRFPFSLFCYLHVSSP